MPYICLDISFLCLDWLDKGGLCSRVNGLHSSCDCRRFATADPILIYEIKTWDGGVKGESANRKNLSPLCIRKKLISLSLTGTYMEQSEDIFNIILAVGLLMGFIFIVSLSVYIIRENFSTSCSCRTSIPFVIAILTSLGVFVGVLTYYLLSKSFFRQKQKIYGNIERTLNFLDSDERRIMTGLIGKGSSIHQNELKKICGMDAVRLHRRLLSLESRGIIRKEKSGMTNIIHLQDDYKEIFNK